MGTGGSRPTRAVPPQPNARYSPLFYRNMPVNSPAAGSIDRSRIVPPDVPRATSVVRQDRLCTARLVVARKWKGDNMGWLAFAVVTLAACGLSGAHLARFRDSCSEM